MKKALHRLYEATGCKTQAQLAKFLEIRQSALSHVHNAPPLPADWLLKALMEKGVNPVWVLTGEGLKYVSRANEDGEKLPESLARFSTRSLLMEVMRRLDL